MGSHITSTSPAFHNGESIPRKFTGDGDDVSPPIDWQGVPEGTREFALICSDPDAPRPQPWIHWVIYGIDKAVAKLPEGLAPQPTLEAPLIALQGKNSWPSGKTVGYRGPAPPKGSGTHHYHFRLFALDAPIEVEPGADADTLIGEMKSHILAEADLVGTYER